MPNLRHKAATVCIHFPIVIMAILKNIFLRITKLAIKEGSSLRSSIATVNTGLPLEIKHPQN